MLKLPDVRSRLEGLGGEPGNITPEQFAALNKAEYERFGKLIKDASDQDRHAVSMKPTIALFTGDPAGIGPELVAKLLADPTTREQADVLLICERGRHRSDARGAFATRCTTVGRLVSARRLDARGSQSQATRTAASCSVR